MAIREALRLRIGRARRYTVKQVWNATGVKDRLLECAMADPDGTEWRALPPEALLSLSMFFGADFTSEWMSLARQGAFDLPDDIDPSPGDVMVQASDDAAEIVRRGMDGAFDSDDRKALKVVGQRKIARGMQLVAMAQTAERRAA